MDFCGDEVWKNWLNFIIIIFVIIFDNEYVLILVNRRLIFNCVCLYVYMNVIGCICIKVV